MIQLWPWCNPHPVASSAASLTWSAWSERGHRSQPQSMAFFFYFPPQTWHAECIGREKSHISAEPRETVTAAALLLSENSALSTTLMCHMTLHGDKCHCPLSNRKDDCMSFTAPSGVWVWLYNFGFFFFRLLRRAVFGCGIGGTCVSVSALCRRISIILFKPVCRVEASVLCDLWGEKISYNFLFF